MQSIRRSIRDSFRRRRTASVVTDDRGKIAEAMNLEAGIQTRKQKGPRGRSTSEPASNLVETSPAHAGAANQQVKLMIFVILCCYGPLNNMCMYCNRCNSCLYFMYITTSQVSPELAGVVSHLAFYETHVSGGGASPCVIASTMGSIVIRYSFTLPEPQDRLVQINRAFIAGVSILQYRELGSKLLTCMSYQLCRKMFVGYGDCFDTITIFHWALHALKNSVLM